MEPAPSLVGAVAATFRNSVYCVVATARYWLGASTPVTVISLAPAALPAYALHSLIRIAVAYFLSLMLAVGYAYLAARVKRLESFLIAVLDTRSSPKCPGAKSSTYGTGSCMPI